MGSTPTKWIKKNVISRYLMTDCPEKEKCFEILYLLLDGEASSEQEDFLYGHIDECWGCFQNYKIESIIKELIQTRLEKKPLPEGLVESIKLKIRESA